MKLLLTFILFTFLICSCNQNVRNNKLKTNKTSTEKDTLNNITRVDAEKDLLDYINKIGGTWVSKDFYNSIIKNKSPFKAQSENPYFLIYINSENIKNNKIGIYDYKYGQTEISEIAYYTLKKNLLHFEFDTFDGKIIKTTNYYNNFTLLIKNNDTVLRVTRNDNKKIDLKKIESNFLDKNYDSEITQLITSKILSGNYKLIDSSKNIISNNINIDKFGQIKGFSKFKRAILWNNFREINHSFEFDVLQFLTFNGQKNGYYNDNDENIFKFENYNDTIKLRSIHFEEEESEVTVGQTKYFLVKK